MATFFRQPVPHLSNSWVAIAAGTIEGSWGFIIDLQARTTVHKKRCSMTDDFKTFIEKRKVVAQAYVNGDAGPLAKIAVKNFAATFFGPMGAVVEGAREVLGRYELDALSFDAGSESDLEIVHMCANGEIGYWAGFQNARPRMKGRAGTIPMRLRVTEIFRKEEGEWRLIHRHADPLFETKSHGTS